MIIREFEKLPYKIYEGKRPKGRDPREETQTWAYCQLLLPNKTACKVYYESWCPQLATLPCKNVNDWLKKKIPILHVCYTDKSKSKEFLVDIILSQIFSMDKDESKVIIVNGNSTEKNES